MTSSPTASRAFAALLLVLGPLASTSLLLALMCRGTMLDCVPCWHDETCYWNEIAVFHRAGFDGGYTGANELVPRAEFMHFGAHGPFFPALLGTLTRAAGLHPASIPLLNAALFIVASTVWLAVVRPDTKRMWIAAFLVNTFWPLVLYLPSSMQECSHYAIAFAIAAASHTLIRAPRSFRARLAALAVVVTVAQIRVTWGWVLLPLAWVAFQPRSWSQWLAVLAGSGTSIASLYAEAVWLYAPFPNFMSDVLDALRHDPLHAVSLVALRFLKGAGHYVSPTRDTWLQLGLRYQVLLIGGAAGYHVLTSRERSTAGNEAERFTTESSDDQPRTRSEPGLAFGFVALNLLSIVGFVAAFYDVHDWRDYRVVAPHLLLSLLVLVGTGAREWLGGYAVLAVLLAAFVPGQFREFHQARVDYDQSQIAEFAQEIGSLAPFEPAADAWDNTLLMHIDGIDTPLIAALPPGIGIAPALDWRDQPIPPKSRYVVLASEDFEQVELPSSFRRIATTRLGELYARDRTTASSSKSAEDGDTGVR